jgi:hypothetical protein
LSMWRTSETRRLGRARGSHTFVEGAYPMRQVRYGWLRVLFSLLQLRARRAGSAHTTMTKGAVAINDWPCAASTSASFSSWSLTAMKAQGCIFPALGARIADFIRISISSSVRPFGAKERILFLFSMSSGILKTSPVMVSVRWFISASSQVASTCRT